MKLESIIYICCGLTGGLLGGYLGLGGGIIMVPFMAIVMGLDIKAAAPISMAAIIVGSMSASTPYLKKNSIDNELAVVLGVFMTIGGVTGSIISAYIPSNIIQLIFSVLVIYAALMLFKKKNESEKRWHSDNRTIYYSVAATAALFTGTIAATLGVGGGIFLIPALYLLFGKNLKVARGTSAMVIGFSATAATAVYLGSGRLDASAAMPVILGVVIGGMIGGQLGTLAKPLAVKIVFLIVMLFTAYKLLSSALGSLL
ncbi:MAG: sulfite exporter TauE/SafE family protein [candidate division Zixibacteria bacterium]|nr:sulfite exporter TauE/SafE family protein [candidate division Zixibacteria bacterium]